MSIILASIFQGCTGFNPTKNEIIGIWKSSDGAILEFKKDGTFAGQSLPGEKIFFNSSEFRDKRFNESGKWDVKKWQDQWVVTLSFNRSPTLKKGYDTRILISGSNGVLENKPPWYLFQWVEEEGGQRYKFERSK